jgi:hypothetical protein
MVDNPPPPNLPPPPPPPVSAPSMRAQGGEITGPLGLWRFPILNALLARSAVSRPPAAERSRRRC